jgi:hypothetical protein
LLFEASNSGTIYFFFADPGIVKNGYNNALLQNYFGIKLLITHLQTFNFFGANILF